MRMKGLWATVLAPALAIAFVLMTGQGAATPVTSEMAVHGTSPSGPSLASELTWKGGTAVPSVASKVKTLCSGLTFTAAAVYNESQTRAYVEDWNTGNLTLCGAGRNSTIATAPSGYAGDGYYGMAGLVVSGKLDLILISWGIHAGWYCLGATAKGCAKRSAFTLPPSFCTNQTKGFCNPDGIVLESNLAFTYVDVVNADLVSCSPKAHACSNDTASSAFTGQLPVDITQLGSTLYVSDNNCTGYIWKGTTKSMKVLYTEGNALEGISFVNKTLYVADDASCGGNAGILKAKTGVELPTPITGDAEIVGLDAALQFSVPAAKAVYSTK